MTSEHTTEQSAEYGVDVPEQEVLRNLCVGAFFGPDKVRWFILKVCPERAEDKANLQNCFVIAICPNAE